MEKVISVKLQTYQFNCLLERYASSKDSQHGFVKRVLFHKFVNIYEKVTNYLDSGYPVDVIYLDFQKAFNKVPHKRLLMKLQVYGIDKNY